MANKSLFKSVVGRLLPDASAINEEMSIAYELTPRHKLAQYIATGCLNSTFYAAAETQLDTVLGLCREVDPEFIAKAAVYARHDGYMKDMPALLCAALSVRDIELLNRIFLRVCDNGRMIRNFVQIMRSGVVGRKSLGTRPRNLVRKWFYTRSDEEVFRASVGNAPSLADIIKMVHPLPDTKYREALYGYLVERDYAYDNLPEIVKKYEEYKAGRSADVPRVPFQMLTSLKLGRDEWTSIARDASWQMTRMNLNTFARHGVFDVAGMDKLIADRLRNPDAVRKARVFPYQLMAAFFSAGKNMPAVIRESLQDAIETAIENVPSISGKVYVCPDVSGSMHSPVTGYRKGATSAVQCIDVAALVAAAFVRKNSDTTVLPFENRVVNVDINARDSVMTNAEKLAKVGGGGTNCSAPLKDLNRSGAKGDLVVYISDNESWVDNERRGATATMKQWNRFKQRNPGARMVCIDLQPYGTVQAAEREDILNIGGFSDNIFSLVSTFAEGRLDPEHWVGVIEKMPLN